MTFIPVFGQLHNFLLWILLLTILPRHAFGNSSGGGTSSVSGGTNSHHLPKYERVKIMPHGTAKQLLKILAVHVMSANIFEKI